ncbi:MAG: hypothetical protein ACOYMR_01990 [Ilumatobacteraceae bacterium]
MHLLGPGGLVAAFVFGFRHGVDWDHLAALADLTNAERDPRRSMRLCAAYVLGHAVVILALGTAAILFAERLPTGLDGVMERVVGVTLVVLGLVVLQSLVRHRHAPVPTSRWMAMREAAHRTMHRHAPLPPTSTAYTIPAAVGIGMLHGVGAETPTQVLLFAGVAAGGGGAFSLAILCAFVVGLIVANTALAAGGAVGFRRIGDRPRLAFALSLTTATFSIAMGVLLVLGQGAVLPPILGG